MGRLTFNFWTVRDGKLPFCGKVVLVDSYREVTEVKTDL